MISFMEFLFRVPSTDFKQQFSFFDWISFESSPPSILTYHVRDKMSEIVCEELKMNKEKEREREKSIDGGRGRCYSKQLKVYICT